MKYPIVIEHVRGAKKQSQTPSFVPTQSRLITKCRLILRNVPSFACHLLKAARIDAPTDWIAELRADETISYVVNLMIQNFRPEPVNLENFPQLNLYPDICFLLFVKHGLQSHCNKRAVSTRVMVPMLNRENVGMSLPELTYYKYEPSLRRIFQRFWSALARRRICFWKNVRSLLPKTKLESFVASSTWTSAR